MSNAIKVFPNPFIWSFHVKIVLAVINVESTLPIMDLPGRMIYRSALNNGELKIDLPNYLSKGIYLLNAEHTNPYLESIKINRQ